MTPLPGRADKRAPVLAKACLHGHPSTAPPAPTVKNEQGIREQHAHSSHARTKTHPELRGTSLFLLHLLRRLWGQAERLCRSCYRYLHGATARRCSATGFYCIEACGGKDKAMEEKWSTRGRGWRRRAKCESQTRACARRSWRTHAPRQHRCAETLTCISPTLFGVPCRPCVVSLSRIP
jgi:hypothetical protein